MDIIGPMSKTNKRLGSWAGAVNQNLKISKNYSIIFTEDERRK